MEKLRKFFVRKDVVFTLQRYGIDALGAMAQGLFCTLLVGSGWAFWCPWSLALP